MSFWLVSTFRDEALVSSAPFIRSFEGEGKVFCAMRSRINRGRFVLVT